MSRVPHDHTDELDSFPRVSGDEPWDTIWQGISTVFSPRERG